MGARGCETESFDPCMRRGGTESTASKRTSLIQAGGPLDRLAAPVQPDFVELCVRVHSDFSSNGNQGLETGCPIAALVLWNFGSSRPTSSFVISTETRSRVNAKDLGC